MESSTVATCPPVGARKGLSDRPRVHLLSKENAWSRYQCLFEENVEKTKMEKVEGLRILKIRVWESFTHGEGINTPRAHHKGWQPLIECANHDFNIIYFPFYLYFPFLCFFTFFGFLCFFLLFWAFYVFYFFGLFMFFTFLAFYVFFLLFCASSSLSSIIDDLFLCFDRSFIP